jgi:hypothetical protein
VLNNIRFNYTTATYLAILGAVIAVAVSFGLGLTQDNIASVMRLAGILLGVTVAGGAWKSRGLLQSGLDESGRPLSAGAGAGGLHFTSATIVAAIAAAIALAVSFGLHLTEENIRSITTLVGLVFGGITFGGGIKSGAMIEAGAHPALRSARGR